MSDQHSKDRVDLGRGKAALIEAVPILLLRCHTLFAERATEINGYATTLGRGASHVREELPLRSADRLVEVTKHWECDTGLSKICRDAIHRIGRLIPSTLRRRHGLSRYIGPPRGPVLCPGWLTIYGFTVASSEPHPEGERDPEHAKRHY